MCTLNGLLGLALLCGFAPPTADEIDRAIEQLGDRITPHAGGFFGGAAPFAAPWELFNSLSSLSSTSTDTAQVATELSVRYGRKCALDQVSLSVAPGSVYALIGLNGAGKSSLVRCLLGLRRPDSGSAQLFGRDVWWERAQVLAEVGVVPEEPDAPAALSAREIARFSARIFPR